MSTLANALAGLKQAQAEPSPEASKPQTTKTRPAKAPAPTTTKATTGKSSNPEYEPVKIYVHRRLRRDASRKWEDATGGDLSGLIEHLLNKYLGT